MELAMLNARHIPFLLILTLFLAACSGVADNSQQPVVNNQPSGSINFGQQLKITGCVASGGLQDKACTPGDIFPDATTDQICQRGYSSTVRNVPQSEKDQVYAEY